MAQSRGVRANWFDSTGTSKPIYMGMRRHQLPFVVLPPLCETLLRMKAGVSTLDDRIVKDVNCYLSKVVLPGPSEVILGPAGRQDRLIHGRADAAPTSHAERGGG